MKISEIIQTLEEIAPPALQEDYDNTGLLTGSRDWECSGIIVCLDSTEEVIAEAKATGANLVIAHHPIIFQGLKQLTGRNHIERTVIAAIKNDIAVYAIHTNLDNVLKGVNGKMASKLGLERVEILDPKPSQLKKLVVFAPPGDAEKVREAIFSAGAGHIGNYSECSFTSAGTSSFKPEPGANPTEGEIGKRFSDEEFKLEFIFPPHREKAIIKAMKEAHSYEEVAYDIFSLSNFIASVGAGIVGNLAAPMPSMDFLQILRQRFDLQVVRHSPVVKDKVQRVALCGGSGSFLIHAAKAAGADIFITGDVKYHEFFEAESHMLIADIGHYESEQFTQELIVGLLAEKFPKFAVRKTGVNTNPVQYFTD